MAFKLPILRDLPPQITSDLPSFQYKDIENERPIAKGGFGFVSKANYQNKTVVIKKITSESSEDEKLFLKEAKLIDSLRHANVVGFIAFCTLPYTLMLEYVAFDFSLFGHSKLITKLATCLTIWTESTVSRSLMIDYMAKFLATLQQGLITCMKKI